MCIHGPFPGSLQVTVVTHGYGSQQQQPHVLPRSHGEGEGIGVLLVACEARLPVLRLRAGVETVGGPRARRSGPDVEEALCIWLAREDLPRRLRPQISWGAKRVKEVLRLVTSIQAPPPSFRPQKVWKPTVHHELEIPCQVWFASKGPGVHKTVFSIELEADGSDRVGNLA